MNNINILEEYIEIDKINDLFNNKMFEFICEADKLVLLSDDMYQIEKTLRLNKISLKDYILNSTCCKKLEEENINEYTIDELKEYFIKYESDTNEDYSSYFLAISLFNLIEEMEELYDKKIENEIKLIEKLDNNINKIKVAEKEEYEKIYNNINENINEKVKEEKVRKISIQVLNDIFNYYMLGYPEVPKNF